MSIQRPTELHIDSREDAIILTVAIPDDPTIAGVNIYHSTEMGGGVDDYTKLTAVPLTVPSQTVEYEEQVSEDVQVDGTSKTTTLVSEIKEKYYVTYEHSSVVSGETQYYVATSVVWNPSTSSYDESPYSMEVSSVPFELSSNVATLPIKTQADLVASYIQNIFQSYPEVDAKPGTVVRDIQIDPPTKEVERLYRVLGFISAAQSWITLNAFDDADDDRISDNAATSENKLALQDALGLASPEDLQTFIDSVYDTKASDVGVVRGAAEQAVGELTFYSDYDFSSLTQEVTIPAGVIVSTIADPDAGISAQRFTTLTSVSILAATAGDYYNPSRARYEFTVPIRANDAGSAGTLPAGVITVIESSVPSYGFNATNLEATTNGQDQESNWSVAQRAVLAFIGVDLGTAGGYLRSIAGYEGVEEAKIVDAGNPYMMRDYDDVRHEHIGGKVDVYVKGDNLVEYTDQVPLEFDTIDEFGTVVNASSMIVQVADTDVSVSKPIFEVIEVHNNTKAGTYILSKSSLLNGNQIDIDETITANASIGMDPGDVIEIRYRYRNTEYLRFQNQPARSISDIDGLLSGDLQTQATFVANEDPLLLGYSASASTGARLVFSGGLPKDREAVADEEHVMNGVGWEDLTKRGVNAEEDVSKLDPFPSLTVTNDAGTIEYILDEDFETQFDGNVAQLRRVVTGAIGDGDTVKVSYNHLHNVDGEAINLVAQSFSPLANYGVVENYLVVKDSTETTTFDINIDYEVLPATDLEPIHIRRIPGGAIGDGDTVKVFYECTENVTSKYVVNSIVAGAQTDAIADKRHITADVLCKEIFLASIIIAMYVKRKAEASISAMNSGIRTAITNLFDRLEIGDDVHQSDIVGVVEQVPEVDYVDLPLTTVARSDNSLIVQELIDNTEASWSENATGTVPRYTSVAGILDHPTIEHGGDYENDFVGMRCSSEPLTQVFTAADVGDAAGQFYIAADGTLTVSLPAHTPVGVTVDDVFWTVSYHVFNETGPNDLILSDLEKVTLEDITINLL